MLKISPISIVFQSLIDAVGNTKVDGGEGNGNKTNLSNLSISKKFTKAGYLIPKSAKKSGNNLNSGGDSTKQDVKAVNGSNYPTLAAKKAFNLLQYAFTKAPIF